VQESRLQLLDDRAPTWVRNPPTTRYSLAPMLVMVIAVAGSRSASKRRSALFGELAELIGPESAVAVQAMLRSASGTCPGS